VWWHIRCRSKETYYISKETYAADLNTLAARKPFVLVLWAYAHYICRSNKQCVELKKKNTAIRFAFAAARAFYNGLKSKVGLAAAKKSVWLRPHENTAIRFAFAAARAFYNGLKSKVGLAAAKTAAMRINLNIDGCGVVVPPVHSSLRAPLLLANLLAHNLPSPALLISARWPESSAQAAASGVL